MRPLYDTVDYYVSTTFCHFLRKLMKINWFRSKNVLIKTLQISVKYNTRLARNPKKRAFLAPQFLGAVLSETAGLAADLCRKKGLTLVIKSLPSVASKR